ncbi:hypothetical protein [Companilactobacillus nodensis]|uniref:Uncharacterized protein n=1 Tax=Companilactobacillus nodensis DSM 19682 = JCM 14932 = NBRC 107160 TaxID=1423775 RepID=A0A0R1KHY9_9LACO|nr:hypothetical protein [Companilactobacillus nodensis]KRK78647.1 hypothetical protein FD03_GL002423 [Companilactobacillus nodensis DSM 19682 = JCM 14932 = NBRC 107160]
MTNVLILGTQVKDDSDIYNLFDSRARTTIIGRNFSNRNVLDQAMENQDMVIVAIDETSSVDLIPTIVESMKIYQVYDIVLIDKLSNKNSHVEAISTEFLKLSGLNYKILDPID